MKKFSEKVIGKMKSPIFGKNYRKDEKSLKKSYRKNEKNLRKKL